MARGDNIVWLQDSDFEMLIEGNSLVKHSHTDKPLEFLGDGVRYDFSEDEYIQIQSGMGWGEKHEALQRGETDSLYWPRHDITVKHRDDRFQNDKDDETEINESVAEDVVSIINGLDSEYEKSVLIEVLEVNGYDVSTETTVESVDR